MYKKICVVSAIVIAVLMILILIFPRSNEPPEELSTESDVCESTEEEQPSSRIMETTEPIKEETTLVPTTVETTEVIRIEDKKATGLSGYERNVAECMVMGEAGGESYESQLMVAYCIKNACDKHSITPSQVRIRYKYYGWNSNPSENVKMAVSEVFDDGKVVIDDVPLYFYATNTYSSWHETQRYICTIGNCKFFGEW